MFRDLFSMNGPYARFMNLLWNMIVISVLWIVCCIPVFTAGPATVAAYYAMAKAVRHHAGTVVSEFFHGFRTNFKQGAMAGLLLVAVLCFLVIDCVYIYSDASIPLPVLYLFYFLVLLVMAVGIYLFPCMSRFYKGLFSLLRMSALLTVRHLLSTILLLLLSGLILVGVYLMPWGILIFPGLGFYIMTFRMEPILLSLSPKPEPDSEEAQKWYYQ